MPWGTGQLPEGWRIVAGEGRENTARLVLLQLQRLLDAGNLEAARRLVEHPYRGRPIGEHLALAVINLHRELVGAPAAPEGALLLPGVERMVQDETARLDAQPLEPLDAPNVDGRWLWWSWPTGEVLAFEQLDGGRGVLWREATARFLELDAQREQRGAADARARRERREAELDNAAAALSPEAAAPAGEGQQGGPAPSPADVAGPTPAVDQAEFARQFVAAERADAAAAELADEDLVEDPEDAPTGPMVEPVAEAVADMQRRALERARAAAQQTLREAQRALTVPEQMLAGGERVPSSPGIRCAFCVRALGHARAVCREASPGAFEWAHLTCAQREDLEGRGVYGTKADMRAELGAAGVELTGGECFDELRTAVLVLRRRNALSVDWAAKPVKTARKERACSLCPSPIGKGQEYRDGGDDRAAHETCVALLLDAQKTVED